MSQIYICSHGHRWQVLTDRPASLAARPILCPVCGALPKTLNQPPINVLGATRIAACAAVAEVPQTEIETSFATPPLAAASAGPRPEVLGYDILSELGRGGMGVVYKARQLSLKRIVALKMILAGNHAAPHELARFRTEVEAVASLQHPNIVQIHEVGEHDRLPYCALEFVDGQSLAQRLARGRISARDSAQLTETLARAIHFAHQRGIIHRDLKPANVLLAVANGQSPCATDPKQPTTDNEQRTVPKITDFGLAKRLDAPSAHTKTGWIVGTPPYMAPEQARGLNDQIGPATDVYALGVILYEMLAGRPPFRAETQVDTILQLVSEEPASLGQLDVAVPPDLQTICLKCLQKEPAQRYETAQALADDLQRFLNSEPILARPMSAYERLARAAKRWRRELVSMLIGAGIVVALVLGLGLLLYVKDPEWFRRHPVFLPARSPGQASPGP